MFVETGFTTSGGDNGCAVSKKLTKCFASTRSREVRFAPGGGRRDPVLGGCWALGSCALCVVGLGRIGRQRHSRPRLSGDRRGRFQAAGGRRSRHRTALAPRQPPITQAKAPTKRLAV